jgi:hypothetical protein
LSADGDGEEHAAREAASAAATTTPAMRLLCAVNFNGSSFWWVVDVRGSPGD